LTAIIPARALNAPKGMRVLQAQAQVTPLEHRLTSLAARDPGVALSILEGIGRHLEPHHVQELRGAARFLEIGGSARALAVTLGNPRIHTQSSVRATLVRFNDLTPQEAASVDAIVSLRGMGERATDGIVGIGTNFPVPGSYYLTIAELLPSSDSGLSSVISDLVSWSGDTKWQGASGVLRAAKKILADHPGARLRFEVSIRSGGKLVRSTDVVAILPAGDPLAYILVEVKEAPVEALRISRRRGEGGGAARQFRKDVLFELRDAELYDLREEILFELRNPDPPPGHPLARIRWFVRHPLDPDGQLISGGALTDYKGRVRQALVRAFDGGALKGHPRRTELIDAFHAHFDEIVQFF
jgi:hypothetical protein